MSGFCRDCKWWGLPEDREYMPEAAAKASPKLAGSKCCLLAGAFDGEPQHPQTLALAMDCEDYQAFLATAPTFGCVQFEPLPPSEAKI